MASRMNSGGSIDLNRIKIDPRTGEKFSFNLDIVLSGHGVVWPGSKPRIEPRTGEKFSFNLDIVLSGHGVVWPGSKPRIEPRTGEKFSFNVDIHVVAATFILISQLILTRIQWPVQ